MCLKYENWNACISKKKDYHFEGNANDNHICLQFKEPNLRNRFIKA